MDSNQRPSCEIFHQQFAHGCLRDTLDLAAQLSTSQGVPLMQSRSAVLLYMLASIKSPRRVLEIGSGYGYSTLLMAAASQAEIITIESDPLCQENACKLFDQSGEGHRIKLVCEDALFAIPKLAPYFDFVFIDADKALYPHYLVLIKPILSSGALVIADDIFFSGSINGQVVPEFAKPEILSSLDLYRHQICQQSEWISSLLPIDCGIAVSIFRGLEGKL
jgi:predicted O-methyltransferase YrrM